MNACVRHDIVLSCHASSPRPGVRGIAARVRAGSRSVLEFGFRLEADLARLRIPVAAPPRWADRLWEHTCFEAFIAARGEPAYHELNFSPSGEWAAYAFRSYRDGGLPDRDVAPAITVRRSGDVLELAAVVRAGCLPPASRGAVLQIALSAVIEDEAGRLSYWALRHPPGRPDFHHRDGFALEIDAPHDAKIDPPVRGDR